jgi:6-pyruvoyltetrahydropterin/6-carboxytetrahydropterin synthase
MYRIGRTFSPISAAHQLPDLGPDHKCSRLHGHNYEVTVTVSAEGLYPSGFVVDFADLSPVGEYLRLEVDHRCLNDVLSVPPTSENFARHVFDWCVDHLSLPDGIAVEGVRVSETPSTWAEYLRDSAPLSAATGLDQEAGPRGGR